MGGKKLPPDRAHLEQLSTEELKEIIRADAESTSGGDEDFIFTVLEVIAEREERQPDYQPPDSDAAWERFQQYYNTPDGVGQSLFPVEGSEEKRSQPAEKVRRMGRLGWKRLAIIAAAIAILLAGVFTAQAAGIDIPGIIARWTDDVFYFEGSATETSGQAEWTEALIDEGVESNVLPTWIPPGFEAGTLSVEDNIFWKEMYQPFYCPDGRQFQIVVHLFTSPEFLSTDNFEKDDTLVNRIEYNGIKVYFFANRSENIATFINGVSEVSVIGNLAIVDLEQIIYSIGGFDT